MQGVAMSDGRGGQGRGRMRWRAWSENRRRPGLVDRCVGSYLDGPKHAALVVTVNVWTQEAIEVLAVCLYHKEKLILESHTLFFQKFNTR